MTARSISEPKYWILRQLLKLTKRASPVNLSLLFSCSIYRILIPELFEKSYKKQLTKDPIFTKNRSYILKTPPISSNFIESTKISNHVLLATPFTQTSLKQNSPGHNQIWIYDDVTHICKMAPTPRNMREGHFLALRCA